MHGGRFEEVLHVRRNGFPLSNEEVFVRFFFVKERASFLDLFKKDLQNLYVCRMIQIFFPDLFLDRFFAYEFEGHWFLLSYLPFIVSAVLS